MLFVDDEVADDGGGEQAREGEDVGERVYILVGVQRGEQARGDPWASVFKGRVRLFPPKNVQRGTGNPLGTGDDAGAWKAPTKTSGVCAHLWKRLNEGRHARCNPDRIQGRQL